MTSWGKSPNYPEGAAALKEINNTRLCCFFHSPHFIRGPSNELSRAQCGPVTSCVETTRPLWRHETSNTPAVKKKKKERKGSKTRRLRCSSCRCLPAEDISSPSDSETPAASLLLMSPHICSALNMQPCVASEAREPRCWNSFCRCTNVAPKGERRKKKKKRFVVTLNECSKSGGAV